MTLMTNLSNFADRLANVLNAARLAPEDQPVTHDRLGKIRDLILDPASNQPMQTRDRKSVKSAAASAT